MDALSLLWLFPYAKKAVGAMGGFFSSFAAPEKPPNVVLVPPLLDRERKGRSRFAKSSYARWAGGRGRGGDCRAACAEARACPCAPTARAPARKPPPRQQRCV